ncbi:hypothetical protein M1L60_07920 [Actinoplanes sp. TRM 88003]|uniref:Uncharacterized protein n=1 Tax=Paractinoplanes aksuensis TaxID=2939490 RepID=A0ABT1DI70_9ACTN|nr:hypothetical protein [Actinoplanes aksuensis]MCO8270522.1 hypothetical protein [Actinoplanes aksuensis]
MRRLALVPIIALAATLGLAVPAQAATVVGPLHAQCRIGARLILFRSWVSYPTPNYSSFTVYRVAWGTEPSFRPSRVAISVRKTNGDSPLVRAWGASQSTLADVGATGDTGSPWGTTQYPTSTYAGVFARFYLNGRSDGACSTPVINVQP